MPIYTKRLKQMENPHYNRIKATHARQKVKAVLAEKNKTETWLSEQMDRSIGIVSRWLTSRSSLVGVCQARKCNH